MRRFNLACFAATLCLAFAGCNSGSPASGGPPPVQNLLPASNPIKHVILIVQENRSFDNLFHGFPGADSDGATAQTHSGPVTITQTTLEGSSDICHFHSSFNLAYDRGKLDNFAQEQTCGVVNGAY